MPYLHVGDTVTVDEMYLGESAANTTKDLRRSTGTVRGISRSVATVELQSGHTIRVHRNALTVTTVVPDED